MWVILVKRVGAETGYVSVLWGQQDGNKGKTRAENMEGSANCCTQSTHSDLNFNDEGQSTWNEERENPIPLQGKNRRPSAYGVRNCTLVIMVVLRGT